MTTAAHPACLAPETLLAACRQRRVRRGGPGGQRRNKVETGVVLRHLETGIEAEASERRSVAENLPLAVRRLRLALAVGIREQPDRQPSSLWQQRCRGGRVAVNPAHDDFPALLAEALDVLADCGWQPADAASQLGCTSSQLVKLLKQCRPALGEVNRCRREAGLKGLR